jgi:hypothetical protein
LSHGGYRSVNPIDALIVAEYDKKHIKNDKQAAHLTSMVAGFVGQSEVYA